MERSEARRAACKAASKRLYHERRDWGVCTVCGKPKKNGETTIICAKCTQYRTEYRDQNRQHINELARARRQRYREQGLCIYCGKPALPGSTRCAHHKELCKKEFKKYCEGKKNDSSNG